MTQQAPPSDPSGFQHQVMDGLSVNLVLAPRMRRFLALCTDLGLVGVFSYVLIIVFALIIGVMGLTLSKVVKEIGTGSGILSGGILVLLGISVIFAATLFHFYFIYFEYKTASTPGKKLFGLKVVSVDGARLSLGQCVIRDLLRFYVDIPFIFPVLIALFTTEKRQRIGDLAANTMVVYSREREEAQKFMYVKQEEYHLLMEYLKPGPVPRDFREAYMKFAYSEFIVRANPAPAHYLEDWTQQVKKLLPEADNLGLNQQTVLRFFGEYCFQTTMKETTERK